MLWQCLRYVYTFDKKGTLGRLGILMLFPLIANFLTIANARLADGLQQNFGTGLLYIIMPVFLVIIGLEILDETFSWLSRSVTWVWQSKLRLLIDVERQKKKSTFTIPFIDSEDYDTLNQRIDYSGSGFNAQINMITNVPTLIRIIINSVFAAGILFAFSPMFMVLTLLSIIPGFSVAFTQQFAMRKNWEKHLTYGRLTSVYGKHFGNYTALKDTKASGSADRILDIFRTRREWYRDENYKVWKKYLNIGYITNLLALAVAFTVQYFVLKDAIDGLLMIGQATLIIAQIFRLQSNLKELSWFLPDQYENVVACKYLFLYLDTKENTENVALPTPTPDLTKGITLQDIQFEYPEVIFKEMRKLNEEIDTVSEKYFGLKKEADTKESKKKESFSLTIPTLSIQPGERVAIVGKNGNGKTTFLQLILNLYQPQKGTIHIFNTQIQHMNQVDIQKYYSMLFQDYAQTDLKAHEYIGLSEIDTPDLERVQWAAKQATADEFIEKWKNTYTQQLGISFKGVKPSKGQWQKLALARAFYKDAPILILDEPTSAIDSISAKKIFENLAQFDPKKILLFVCHNMVDIPLAATRILVFDKGTIVGDGSHKTLLKTCDVYKELYESEKGGK